MKRVAVSCDGGTILPKTAEKYGFTVIPCPIIMDGKQYLEPEVNMDELYTALENRENLPTTAIANPEEFAQHFTRLSQEAEAILHICQTPVFTALYKNALQAREMLSEKLPKTRIEVVNSFTAGIGPITLAIGAAKAAAQGKGIDEIKEFVNSTVPRLSFISNRDTLFYLDKGGRICEARDWAKAEPANSFRAILEVNAITEGIFKPIARVKTLSQVMEKFIDIAKERTGPGQKLHGAIGYSRGAEERVEKLKEMLLSELKFDWLYAAEYSAAVVVHNGRGQMDLAFYTLTS
jgi:DegV family protein with EDD domain